MLASAAVRIRLGHSPDPDDAFMFWALAEGRIDPRGFEFEHVLRDVQTLNEWALEGRLEVTALSLHAYPFVQERYVLLPHGASMGSGYGPIVVAREQLSRADATPAFRQRCADMVAPVPRARVLDTWPCPDWSLLRSPVALIAPPPRRCSSSRAIALSA